MKRCGTRMKPRALPAAMLLLVIALVCGTGTLSRVGAERQNETDLSPLASETPEAFPKIQFDALKHDFGSARQGDHLEYIFNFKNVGEATLHIQKVKGG